MQQKNPGHKDFVINRLQIDSTKLVYAPGLATKRIECYASKKVSDVILFWDSLVVVHLPALAIANNAFATKHFTNAESTKDVDTANRSDSKFLTSKGLGIHKLVLQNLWNGLSFHSTHSILLKSTPNCGFALAQVSP